MKNCITCHFNKLRYTINTLVIEFCTGQFIAKWTWKFYVKVIWIQQEKFHQSEIQPESDTFWPKCEKLNVNMKCKNINPYIVIQTEKNLQVCSVISILSFFFLLKN